MGMKSRLFAVFGFLLGLGIAVPLSVNAGTLTCSISAAASCTGGTNAIIFRMSSSTNAHAELPNQSTAAYSSKVVCCSGVTGLGNTCGGTFAVAAKLQAVTNSHIEQNSQANYSNNACISVSSGSISIGYQNSSCSGYDTLVASMSGTTNAHVANQGIYTTKICATASASSQSLTFSLGSNVVNLSLLSTGSVATGVHTMNVSTNAASGVNVVVSGSTLSSGANTVTACTANCSSTAGTSQFGINLVANTTPALGADPSGTPTIGVAATNYNTANSFRYNTGEIVANSTGAINDTTYTVSYIANISPVTAAGSYSTSLQYIATANF